ncbi:MULTISPECIES: sugar ABC transporter substrate-binding protein [unclassified Rhizobium]|uniref:ABC transporter substrate-binding protein n=1 Tax=unclassified Rhizobium TaxID=2613769 RepID=UPI001C832C8D|nr:MULTISPECIES: sugar ABC transporter substrate-binding protein [unclassified Rhizobium]MBX5216042.1 sugar ABC transporter substrate-binding protein [Rhizobium sp. NLR9a]MBX5246741.1 sugar ABC transporter substrate-binding protein [Rhizobium sp. NLR3b]MBX5277343.1 sugar ABC transporter substrate-binding protein [Rhizobium sp. NLR13a]MBX5283425.1 sugar ABC transporter substrate-binding protein [Rhizobium sp. NLR10a]MBX5296721.1 sugar ABC transporter substrate-binding protein [Rhizobium sp. NLR
MGKRLLQSLILSSALAATWAVAAEKTAIQVMHQGDPGFVAAYGKVAERFEAANPDVDVQFIYAPHDAYNEKFSAAVMAKQLPDIMELDAPFLANYVWSGYLQPIKPLIDKDLLDDMTESNIAQGTYPIDKDLYAIGLTDSSVVLYGNRKYLEAIGARIPKSVDDAWTREEFETYLEKLSKLEGVKWPIDTFRGYGIKTEWITYAYGPILQSAGCDLIDRKAWKSEGTLDSDACVDALAMMQKWVKNGWVVPQSAGTNQFYAEGNPAALALGGHWVYAEAVAAMKDNLVVLPLPKFGTKGASPNGTWIWAITKTSKHPDIAAKFISFLLKDKEYRAYVASQSGYPGLKSFAAESPLYANGGPMATAFEQASKTAVARPPHPAYPTITSAFMQAVDEVFNGGDPKEALTSAAKKIDEDIEDNDGYPPFGDQE